MTNTKNNEEDGRPCGDVLADVDDVTEADLADADFDAEEVSE